MKKFLVFSVLATFLGTLSHPAFAQEGPTAAPQPPKHPKAGGAITAPFGPAGTGFPSRAFSAVINYRYMTTDGVRFKNNKINDNVELTKHIGLAKFRYGIMPGLDVRTSTPFYNIERKNRVSGAEDDMGWVGDTALIFHKVLLDQTKGDALHFALDVGVSLPTASVDDDSNDFLGNQAWGGIVGLGLTYFTTNGHRFDQEINYATFTEGRRDYRKPDRFRSNTGWAYAINTMFDVGLESNLEWNGESERDGKDMGDSKWEWYAGPKAVFKYTPLKLTAGVAATFPVYRWYEANTPSDDFRIEFKLVKLFTW